MRPSETRSPLKRSITKIFLFFFVIGGLFSSVEFAMNGGSVMPKLDMMEVGLLPWVNEFVTANGGATFFVITSYSIHYTKLYETEFPLTGNLRRLISSLHCIFFLP